MSEPRAVGWADVREAFDDRATSLVHVLRILVDTRSSLEAADDGLTSDERQRADRFRLPGDRQRFVVGRLALRAVLATWSDEPGTALELMADAQGKLYLARHPELTFNLSHSGDVVMLAWGHVDATGDALGVDVEKLRPVRDLAALAKLSLPATICRDLLALPLDRQTGAFFSQWVRQEALLKAEGSGLAGLDALRAAPSHPGWSVESLSPAPGHVAAVAVRRERADVRLWSATPATLVEVLCSSLSTR